MDFDSFKDTLLKTYDQPDLNIEEPNDRHIKQIFAENGYEFDYLEKLKEEIPKIN